MVFKKTGTKKPAWAEPQIEKKVEWGDLIIEQNQSILKALNMGDGWGMMNAVEGLMSVTCAFADLNDDFTTTLEELSDDFNKARNNFRNRYGNNDPYINQLSIDLALKKWRAIVRLLNKLKMLPQPAEYGEM